MENTDQILQPAIFLSYYIYPKTYFVNYWEGRRIEIITGFFFALILVLLYFWIVY